VEIADMAERKRVTDFVVWGMTQTAENRLVDQPEKFWISVLCAIIKNPHFSRFIEDLYATPIDDNKNKCVSS